MGDILFFVKMLVLTLVLVLIMQVKIGSTTVEQKILHWTHQSSVGTHLQGAAADAVIGFNRITQKIWQKVSPGMRMSTSDVQVPGQRLKAKIREWQGKLEETSSGEQ